MSRKNQNLFCIIIEFILIAAILFGCASSKIQYNIIINPKVPSAPYDEISKEIKTPPKFKVATINITPYIFRFEPGDSENGSISTSPDLNSENSDKEKIATKNPINKASLNLLEKYALEKRPLEEAKFYELKREGTLMMSPRLSSMNKENAALVISHKNDKEEKHKYALQYEIQYSFNFSIIDPDTVYLKDMPIELTKINIKNKNEILTTNPLSDMQIECGKYYVIDSGFLTISKEGNQIPFQILVIKAEVER